MLPNADAPVNPAVPGAFGVQPAGVSSTVSADDASVAPVDPAPSERVAEPVRPHFADAPSASAGVQRVSTAFPAGQVRDGGHLADSAIPHSTLVSSRGSASHAEERRGVLFVVPDIPPQTSLPQPPVPTLPRETRLAGTGPLSSVPTSVVRDYEDIHGTGVRPAVPERVQGTSPTVDGAHPAAVYPWMAPNAGASAGAASAGQLDSAPQITGAVVASAVSDSPSTVSSADGSAVAEVAAHAQQPADPHMPLPGEPVSTPADAAASEAERGVPERTSHRGLRRAGGMKNLLASLPLPGRNASGAPQSSTADPSVAETPAASSASAEEPAEGADPAASSGIADDLFAAANASETANGRVRGRAGWRPSLPRRHEDNPTRLALRAARKERRAAHRAAKRARRRARLPETVVSLVASGLVVVLAIAMLYFPAQDYYLAVRENERLADELNENVARNEQMQTRVNNLQTQEGIEDEARARFGLVLPGENLVKVVGVDDSTQSDFATPAEVPRGSGQNAHTWGTDLLDRIFGVDVSAAVTSDAPADEPAQVTEGAGDSAMTDAPQAVDEGDTANGGADIVVEGEPAQQ
ncbi:MAG: septum formation initiator family protein [Coriobacteriia bacterium]|nr:septum formation initiator family protein [Coriobacteriia bacterium]